MTKWITVDEQGNVPDLLKYTQLKSSKFLPLAPSPSVVPGVRCNWIEVKPPMYLKVQDKMISDEKIFWYEKLNTAIQHSSPIQPSILTSSPTQGIDPGPSMNAFWKVVVKIWTCRECWWSLKNENVYDWGDTIAHLHFMKLKILKIYNFQMKYFLFYFIIQGFIASHKQCTHKTL